MNSTVWSLGVALLWAAGAGLSFWVLTWPFYRRSLAFLLARIVLTGTLASIAAIIGSVRSMFISGSDQAAIVWVAVVAGLVTALTAAVAARRLTRDNRALRQAVTEVGSGQVPSASRRALPAELEQVRRELNETAHRLAESRDRERALDSSRRDLVAWVSHDLRTPLAGLRAMAEALEDGVGEPSTYVKQIRAEVDRLSTMVDDLFELSRIQSGRRVPPTVEVSLVDLVSDCVASLEPLATVHDVRLSGSGAGRVTVHGSGHELNRAVTNLVANAIRHTPAEGTVVVTVRRDAPGVLSASGHVAEVAEVVVQDECGGIPAHDLERIFEAGYRSEADRTPRPPDGSGAGLGLAITRGIVEAHDGTVTVRNVGPGCAFTLRLPLAG